MTPITTGGPAEMLLAGRDVGQYWRWPREQEGLAGGRRMRACASEYERTHPGVMITVVTVTFNAVDTIRQCLNSVRDQEYPNVEHIVIDGGSTDGTLDVIREFDDTIDYWISEPDSGIYDAMNKGLFLSKGDVVGILNSDDYYLDGALSTVSLYFEKEGADYVFGAVNKDGRIKYGLYPEGRFRNLQFYPGHSSGAFFRLSVHRRIGIYPTTFVCSADRYLIYRMVEDPTLSGCATAQNEVVGYFRGNGFSSTRTERQRVVEEYRIRVAVGAGKVKSGIRALLSSVYRIRGRIGGHLRGWLENEGRD